MYLEKDENVPFFITLYDPIAIFVFDNEIFGCELVQMEVNPHIIYRNYELNHGHVSSEPSFLFLNYLYQHDFCRKYFPEKLRKYFEQTTSEEFPKHYKHFTQAFRYPGKTCNLFCLLDIDSTNSTEKPITIKDFSFEGLLLKQTVTLHPQEAFYIFANICTNAFCRAVLPLNKISLEKSLNQAIKQNELLSYNEKISSFAVDYLEYLVENFASGDLKPEFILRMSGARLLMALSYNESVSEFINKIILEITSNTNLTKTKKIIYSTLLLLLSKQPNTSKTIKNFYKTSLPLLKEMAAEIKKPFPKPTPALKGLDVAQEENEKVNLPLFWFQGQPIEIYVLKNKLLGAITGAGSFDWGSAARPLQLLSELNEISDIGKELSIELKEYLDNIDIQQIKARSYLYKYLLGWDDPYGNIPFLDLNLKNHPSKDGFIILHNITYLNQKLDFDIVLTTFETFILLANIYISKFLMDFEGLIHKEGKNCSLERFQEIGIVDYWGELSSEENAIKDEDSEVRKQILKMPWVSKREHFSLLYLKFARELMLSKKTTPFEVLRLSGAPTLVILATNFPLIYEFVKQILVELKDVEKLPLNHKIMYFTLLEMIDDKLNYKDFNDPVRHIVKEFYEEHYSIIHSISNLLEKSFPISERAILDWTSRS